MTTINFSTNCSISFPVASRTANRLQAEVRRACRCQDAEINSWSKEWVVDEALFGFGIGYAVSGIYNVIEVDSNGDRWLTPIADLLSHGTRCYDWSDGYPRTAGYCPSGNEAVYSFGGAHCGYKTILPKRNDMPVQAREYFSTMAEKYYHQEVEAAKAELLSARKSWGQKKNEELVEAGCSTTDIKAWWNMGWKKEWSASEWQNFCQYSDQQISLAMAGESGDYLEVVLGRTWHGSVPRTKDAVNALGKARDLKRRYWKDWKKGGTIIQPVEDGSDGRLWRF